MEDLDDETVKCVLISKNIQDRKYICTYKTLGKGSYSKVYKGFIVNGKEENNGGDSAGADTDMKQYVAIKKMSNLQLKAHECLENEIEIMKKLDHPNILKMIDMIEKTDKDGNAILYIILEFCGGGDLKKLVSNNKESRKLKEKYAMYYFRQIAEGLQYLRSQNIIHRDLKPHNILLSDDRKTLKIADFGFAKIIGSEMLAETLCGSPLYMAPEILHKKPYTSKADLWSVGVMLFEVLCGSHPFKSIESIVDLVHKMDNNVIQIPNNIDISSTCKDLLKKLLKKDPYERIEWEQFFTHEWFNSSLQSSNRNNRPVDNGGATTFQTSGTITNNFINTPSFDKSTRSLPIINNYSTPNRVNNLRESKGFIAAMSPPSFIGSPVVRETYPIKIIDNYVHPEKIHSTPILAFESGDSTSATSTNSATSATSKTESSSRTPISQHISDYVGTSIKMLKDSIRSQSFHTAQ